MKILFAIQGTGNGHISRARGIIPYLKKYGELDILISGNQADVELNYPVKYKSRGISFVFGKSGGIDYWLTFKNLRTAEFLKEVLSFPINHYDVVLNDFEPLTAWAGHFKNKEIISLSHQWAFSSHKVPRPPEPEKLGEFVLKNYAPCNSGFGFHFEEYDDFIFTPVIRPEIRQLEVRNKGHYTVYLPAYSDDKLIFQLSKVKDIEWHVFSKHSKESYRQNNVFIKPVINNGFIESLSSCEGLITGAGFESPAETIFLCKKLMVIPMKRQYEQQCNAAALEKLGVPMLREISENFSEKIESWINDYTPITINYPDNVDKVLDQIFAHKRLESIR